MESAVEREAAVGTDSCYGLVSQQRPPVEDAASIRFFFIWWDQGRPREPNQGIIVWAKYWIYESVCKLFWEAHAVVV